MPENSGYVTVSEYGVDEFVEKKSRFIGYARPVSDADEAMEFVKEIKKKHNDARHNCFAYSLKDGSLRYSDDGEPQGTAGQPILDVLVRSGVTDCVVVVTRYFGGVLLGTGGLTRAYTEGAKIAINAAKPVEMIKAKLVAFNCDYSIYGSIQTLLAKHGATIDNSDFQEDIHLEILVLPSDFKSLCDDICELSAGKIIITEKSEKFLKKSALI